MPIRLPYGPNPLDPRQPRPAWVDPRTAKTKIPMYYEPPPASPIHLSGSVVIASGANATVPASALKNPMGQDMEILEIKFELSLPAFVLSAYNASFAGATIACELTMGSLKLTNGSIPVFLFGRAENLSAESKYDRATETVYAAFTWRLPRPLFVPAGAAVVPNFTHTGMTPDAINVRIGYSARTIFVKPRRIYVPWVAKYSSKSFNPISAADTDASIELDLVNPNPETLYLQRFVGRTVSVNPSYVGKTEGPVAFSSQYLSARITDSYGRPIVRDFTPFYGIFSPLTRSWEMDNGAVLDPESYYLVNLRKDAMTMSAFYASAYAQAFISMVGWRELEAS